MIKKFFSIERLVIFFSGIAFIFHIHYLFYSILYGDEIVSLFNANSFRVVDYFSFLIEIVHPNFYYLFLKAINVFFLEVIEIKAIHFMLFLFDIYILYKISKMFVSSLTQKLVFIFPFLSSLYFMRYAYMLRMYSIGIFAVCSSFYFFLRGIFKKNKFALILSFFIDIVALFFVYGYILFVLLKFLFLLIDYKYSFVKEKSFVVVLSLLIIIPFCLYILKVNFGNVYAYHTHLDWVRVPNLYDYGLSFLSLSGIGFFNYFELLEADIVSFDKFLGYVISFMLLVYLYKKSKLIISDGRKKPSFILFFFFFSSLVILLLLLIFNSIFKLHFFHVRQMFPLSVFISVFLGYKLALYKNKRLVLLIITFLSVNTMIGYKNIFYPKFFFPERNNNEYVLTDEYDYKAIFYVCGAKSTLEAQDKCATNNIVFDINDFNIQNEEHFFISHEKYEDNKNTRMICKEKFGDYYKCYFSKR